MADPLRVVLLFASLPAYFPERHGVFEAARKSVQDLTAERGARLTAFEKVLIGADDTREAIAFAEAEGADFVLVLHGGFTMGDVAATLARTRLRLGFWAVPEPAFEGDIQLNNFVSLNMSLSIADGARDRTRDPVAWYFGAPEDPRFRQRLAATLDALRIQKAASNLRVGLVGGVAPSFYNMHIDRHALGRRWGTEIVDFEIEALRDAAAVLSTDVIDTEAAALGARGTVDVSDGDMRLTAAYALALKGLAEAHGLDALAVSDWPALQDDPGFHPGAAFSWAEEAYGLAVASEGDVLGALSHVAARAAGGVGGCLVDLCAPDPETGLLLAWHGGGGPLHLADTGGVRWIAHPMLGRNTEGTERPGTIADYRFAEGPVTLIRIGKDGGAVFALEAEVTGAGPNGFSGARGWIGAFRMNGQEIMLNDVIDTVMHHGIEHHFVLFPGHHGAAFGELATWSGSRLLGAVAGRSFLPAVEGQGRS